MCFSIITSSEIFLAILNALITSSCEFTQVVIPLPWFPSLGLMTTENPISSIALLISSSFSNMTPFGNGMHWSDKSLHVSSLSDTVSTAIELVVDAMVAWIFFWLNPCPSIIKDLLSRRLYGISLFLASFIIACVLGPKPSSRAIPVNSLRSASRSYGRSCLILSTIRTAALPAYIPAVSIS